MMRIRTVLSATLFVALAWGVILSNARAATGKERLLSFYNDVRSMRAEFTQIVKAQGFNGKDTSKGVFRLLRPGRFRWDYDQPLNVVLGQTPAVLLSGTASLTDRFEIKDMPERHDLDLVWVLLTPKDKDTSYEKLMLGFGKDNIKAMELVDNFGQVTLLKFSHLQRNPKIDPSVFQFKPPPGVDVIGDEDTKP